MKATQMRRSKGSLFNLDIAKERATIICILTETQRQTEEWENIGKGRFQALPEWKLLAWESSGWAN